ncbi:MAG: septum formation initiator family protein [Thermodesulfovibrionaceae bacterium]
MRHKRLYIQLRKERKRKNILFCLIFSVIFAFLIYNFFFGEMGYINYLKLKQNEKKLIKEIKEISVQNQILKREIELLKKEPAYQEKYAREKFGLVKPGEMVFQFQILENEH